MEEKRDLRSKMPTSFSSLSSGEKRVASLHLNEKGKKEGEKLPLETLIIVKGF